MRIAVTGAEGQVVRALAEVGPARDVEIVAVGRPVLDLARPETIGPALAATGADIVVSAAAYTAVDQAEDEAALAEAINAAGAGAVAQAAATMGVPVIHLSTDYVFDGQSSGARVESDPTGPQGVYGRTKLAGETAVAAANPRHLILRTAWVYSPFGRNFVRTMLRLAADRDEIGVVADQWGNPTSALDIAAGIIHSSIMLSHEDWPAQFGVYHLAGTGDANWAGFARHVLETSRALGGPHASVRDIATSDYPTKAGRPANSRLSSEKFTAAFGWRAPRWQESVEFVVRRLLEAERSGARAA
jgi:dTDP-4-dehydrorhamnose reductase